MKRCSYCGRFIWPWQRRGWRIIDRDTTKWWHSECAGWRVHR